MADLVTLASHDGVGVITIHNPPVNALSPGVPEGIDAAVAAANRDPGVEAIVLIGAGRTFIAGADITQLGRGEDPDWHGILERMEDSIKPLVIALHGTALGGGLEFAMAGHYRVAAADSLVGQPEVNLGLIPGAEGTQRLPRLAGIAKAVEMCVSGAPVRAQEALAAGIIDEIVEGDLLAGAIAFAKRVAARGGGWPKTRERLSKLGGPAENEPIFARARELAHKTRRNEAAPLIATEAIQAATTLLYEQGWRLEKKLFRECLASTQAKAMIHAFLGEREVAKVPGIGKETPVRSIARCGILGSGTAATDLGAALSQAGIAVLSGGDAGFDEADLIVEASVTPTRNQRLDSVVGLNLIGRLMEITRGRATASETIATALALAKKLKKVGVVVLDSSAGTRMMARVAQEARSLVDDGAMPEQLDQALYDWGLPKGFLGDLGPGHAGSGRTIDTDEIVSRFVYALVNEGARIVEEGCALRANDIDIIFLAGYGFPVYRGGPLWYADTIGLDRVLRRIEEFRRQHGERWEPAPLLRRLVKEGKTFAGFDQERRGAQV